MREIKFRAWNKLANKMAFIDMLDFMLDSYRATAGRSSGSGHLADIELMQFTGLKDRNDKEIYEGDIIKCYDGITESYFNSVVEWQIRELTHEVATVPLEVSGFIIGSLSEVEVIGNIYENHELLEATA